MQMQEYYLENGSVLYKTKVMEARSLPVGSLKMWLWISGSPPA